jgi:hypothetical protein
MPGFQYQPYDNSGSIGQILQLMQAGAHAHADAARQTAEANSRAAQIKAQNSAQLAGSLGSIIANTGQQIAQPFTPEGRAHQMQLEEQQRTIEEDKALRTLFAKGQPKPEDVYQVVGPKRGAEILKGFSALSEQNVKTDTAKLQKIADLTAGVLAWPEAGQAQAYTLARQHLISGGFGIKPEDIPEQFDRAFVLQKQQEALTAKERLDASRAEATAKETGRHNAAMEGRPVAVAPGSSLVAPGALTAMPGQPAGQPVTPIFTAPERVQKPASVQEFEYAKTQGYKGSYQQYQTEDANRRKPVVNVSSGTPAAGALDEDGLNYAATQYRLTGQMPALGMGKNADRGKIINEAAKQAKLLGQTPAIAMQRQAARKADTSSLTKMQTMKDGAEAAESKALGQADIIAELSKKVSRTSWPLLNKALLAGAKDIGGDSNTTQLYNAILTFGQEYGKLVEGSSGSVSGSSEGARTAAAKLVNAAMSKGTLSDVLGLMKKEMGLTIQGYDATIDHISGRLGGQAPAPPPQAAAPAAAPAPAAGGQIVVTAPDGSKHPFTTQAQADAFKRLAGIQ